MKCFRDTLQGFLGSAGPQISCLASSTSDMHLPTRRQKKPSLSAAAVVSCSRTRLVCTSFLRVHQRLEVCVPRQNMQRLLNTNSKNRKPIISKARRPDQLRRIERKEIVMASANLKPRTCLPQGKPPKSGNFHYSALQSREARAPERPRSLLPAPYGQSRAPSSGQPPRGAWVRAPS